MMLLVENGSMMVRGIYDRRYSIGLCEPACTLAERPSGRLGSRYQVKQVIHMTSPGAARLPGIHDDQSDRHGDGDVDEADQEQFSSLAHWEAGADERVEDRKEDERDGERLEQRDDEEAKLAQMFVA